MALRYFISRTNEKTGEVKIVHLTKAHGEGVVQLWALLTLEIDRSGQLYASADMASVKTPQ